jgi:hypothetical protein
MFCSRETTTANGLRGGVKESIRRAKVHGRPVPLEPMTPLGGGGREGMEIASAMLERSLEPEKNRDTYIQFVNRFKIIKSQNHHRQMIL